MAQIKATYKPILELQRDFDAAEYYSAIDGSPMLVYVGRHSSTGKLRLESPVAGNLHMQDMFQCVFCFTAYTVFPYFL